MTRYQFHTKRVDVVLLAVPLRAGRGQPKTPNVCQNCQSLVTVTVTASASLGLSALRAPWSIPVRLVPKPCTFVPMYFRTFLKPVRHGFESEQHTHPPKKRYVPLEGRCAALVLVCCAKGRVGPRGPGDRWIRPDTWTHGSEKWYSVNTCLQKDGQPNFVNS